MQKIHKPFLLSGDGIKLTGERLFFNLFTFLKQITVYTGICM